MPFPALGVIARVYPHKTVGVTVEWVGAVLTQRIAAQGIATLGGVTTGGYL